eukprot:1161389-Pelagomonas_calceolata.AAC.3
MPHLALRHSIAASPAYPNCNPTEQAAHTPASPGTPSQAGSGPQAQSSDPAGCHMLRTRAAAGVAGAEKAAGGQGQDQCAVGSDLDGVWSSLLGSELLVCGSDCWAVQGAAGPGAAGRAAGTGRGTPR